MKKIFLALASILLLTGLTGCKSNPGNTRLLAHTSAYVGTAIMMEERPDTRPYLLTAAAVICQAANGTNANPAVLMEALQGLPNQSPYGALFVNTTLSLWLAYYDGANPQANDVLLGTCSGMNMGLMSGRTGRTFPHIKVGK